MKPTKKLSLQRSSVYVLSQANLGAVGGGRLPNTMPGESRVRETCPETGWPPCTSEFRTCFGCPIIA